MRRSLGATSWHVAGQILSETLLIALLGGLLGWVIAAGGIRLLSILGADQLPLGATIAFNGRLAIAALLGSIVFGLLVAVPIAWFCIRRDPGAALQSESRGASGNRAVQGLRHVFTVIQIAVAFSLLAGAGMLGVSLQRLLGTSPGFQPAQVFTGQVVLPFNNYGTDTARQQFVERLVGALKGEPGVTSAAVSCLMPFAGKDSSGITAVEGAEKGAQHIAYRNGVVGEYWRTLGIPLLEGRWLGDADNAGKPRVCVVDEAFARRNWHGKSPLGRRINDGIDFKPDESFTIVGVVGTVKQWEVADTEPLGTVYYPFRFWSDSAISVAVRSSLPPSVLGPALQRIVAQLDPQLPIDNLKPMQARIDDSLSSRRSPAVLAGIFAVVALLLTATGTYGVLSYAVGQRRREIGVRMALGALPQQVLAQFLGLGAKLVLVGIVLGFFGAWMAGRLMQSLLFGVGTLHPGILAAAAGLMVSVVLLATLIPSLRAARVSPTEALRGE
ncbi:MAG TPA: FtsX-like permease family protein [Candidatus Limnocylindria bacterium]|nr:FtsX-like permease family protein [Candidatus Limnocylindria bacterium]